MYHLFANMWHPWRVLLQHSIMLRLFFIAKCGIVRFLCTVCVFKVPASSSSPRLPLCNFVSFAASIAELADGEKSLTHLQSFTHLAYLMRQELKLVLRNIALFLCFFPNSLWPSPIVTQFCAHLQTTLFWRAYGTSETVPALRTAHKPNLLTY